MQAWGTRTAAVVRRIDVRVEAAVLNETSKAAGVLEADLHVWLLLQEGAFLIP